MAEPETASSMEVAEEQIFDELTLEFEALAAVGGGVGASAEQWQALLSSPRLDDVAVKVKEKVMYKLARIFCSARRFGDVADLLQNNNGYLNVIPKAKTAKIVRSILAIVAEEPDSSEIQVKLCKDLIEWCKVEKRTFLRQRIEAKLAVLFLERKDLNAALALVNSLLFELKKLDDKQMLTEVHLTEARIYHALQNIPKSKSSLTASRAAANSIYVSPLLQAELDEMSGVLCCEEGDNGTAFSYFLEVGVGGIFNACLLSFIH
jgi:26S proteasome regulatory subunit N6